MYIGLDCGTQGTKAVVWDGYNSVLGMAYQAHDIMSDEKGKQEQQPSWWLEAAKLSIKEALVQAGISGDTIKAIGISGQQHGLVVLDEYDTVIRPAKLWCDTETTEDFEKFKQNLLPKTFVQLIGIQVPVAFTIAKLAWLKSNEPENFNRIAKIMLPHDYLNFCFTGEYRCEAGDASGTGYFDTRTHSWSHEILDALEFNPLFKLPQLISSSQAHGQIRPSIAIELGINPKALVSSGGGDNMMAAIGTGNVIPGVLTMSLGTSGTVYTHNDKQIDSLDFPDINAFCSSTNGYLPLCSTMNVTSATTAFRNLFDCSIQQFERQISRVPHGSGGLQVFPYFVGARLPNLPKAKASIHGLNAHNFSQQYLLRSVVEGVCFNLAQGVDIMKASGLQFAQVSVIGGGSNSATWRQIISDVCELEVVSPKETEVGALGAAMQARWCHESEQGYATSIVDICQSGITYSNEKCAHPIPQHVSKYREIYQEYISTMSQHYPC